MLNRAELIGYLGGDPELNYTNQTNTAVCNFRIATTERWKDRQNGELKEKTQWHRIVCYKGLAEVCAERLSKGDMVYVAGKIQYSTYQSHGEEKKGTDIVANTVLFLKFADKNKGDVDF